MHQDPADIKTVGLVIFDNQHTQYLKFNSKQFPTRDSANDIRSSTYSRKEDLMDKSDNHVLYRRQPNSVTAAAYGMGSYAKPMEGREVLSFLSGGGGEKLFTQCIFRCDFLSLSITIVMGFETIP